MGVESNMATAVEAFFMFLNEANGGDSGLHENLQVPPPPLRTQFSMPFLSLFRPMRVAPSQAAVFREFKKGKPSSQSLTIPCSNCKVRFPIAELDAHLAAGCEAPAGESTRDPCTRLHLCPDVPPACLCVCPLAVEEPAATFSTSEETLRMRREMEAMKEELKKVRFLSPRCRCVTQPSWFQTREAAQKFRDARKTTVSPLAREKQLK